MQKIIHCPTKELFEKAQLQAFSEGYGWIIGGKELQDFWSKYRQDKHPTAPIINAKDYLRMEKTLENLEVGDFVIDEDGAKKKVLAVTGELVALSYFDEFDEVSGWWTVAGLKERYYKPANDEVQEAIATLEKHGKIRDGKIIE